ncbi:MAG TPA: GNAT family N-acetyltransferase [Anaerolineales bacterium]|nr:GNAT family N-acetyltransferase [Anaerolineales bacterium]
METIELEVNIRPGVRGDLPALEWDGEYRHFRRLYADTYFMVEKGQAVIWIAEAANEGVVGQVFVSLSGARSELSDGLTRAYIYGFRVRPMYRSKGIGTRLLHTLEDDLVQRNFLLANLNVGRDNHGAIRFYERMGYHIVAAEPGRWSYIDDKGRRCDVCEPAWRMEKALLRTRQRED